MSNKNDGGSADYYELPAGARELQDLIEHKEMNFAVGNIFKAAYRLGAENALSNRSRDLRKIMWFAQRELDRITPAKTSAEGETMSKLFPSMPFKPHKERVFRGEAGCSGCRRKGSCYGGYEMMDPDGTCSGYRPLPPAEVAAIAGELTNLCTDCGNRVGCPFFSDTDRVMACRRYKGEAP